MTRRPHVDDEFLQAFDFVMRAGRAVAQPIWEGAFQRDDSTFGITDTSARQAGGTVYRDFMVHWFQDLARTLDYVDTREDLDADRIGYLGFSGGGSTAPIVLALEPRITAAVLNVGGLWGALTDVLPESDPLHFAPHVTTPVLMLNGEFDPVFPLETDQRPLYELWGTTSEHKEHIVVEAAHTLPRDVYFRESLDWYDRYLEAPGR